MTDEIKRAAEDILNRSLPFAWTMYEKLGIEKLEKEFAEALLAERRKAYEDCARIAGNHKMKRCGRPCYDHDGWIACSKVIANEIRRRMEGVC